MEITEEQVINEPITQSSVMPVNKNRKLLMTIIPVLFFLFFIPIIVLMINSNNNNQPVVPSPSPTQQASISAKRVPSSLAIDPAFGELEKKLQSLDQDLASIDLSESKLALPILELNVNFEK